MNENKLKPCPFCGGNGRVSFKDYKFGGWNGVGDSRRKYRVQVICNKCRSRGKPIITNWVVNLSPYSSAFWYAASKDDEATNTFKPYVDKAIEAWNRRAGDE